MNIDPHKLRSLLFQVQEVEDQLKLMGLDWAVQIVKNTTAPEPKWAKFVYIPKYCAQNKINTIKQIRAVTGFDLKRSKGIVDEGEAHPGKEIPLVGCTLSMDTLDNTHDVETTREGREILQNCFKVSL